jgi:hypothetical protein
MARVVEEPCGFNEVLRGQAPSVDARAAHGALLRHDRRFSELLRREGCGKRRGAGAKNGEVKLVSRRLSLLREGRRADPSSL